MATDPNRATMSAVSPEQMEQARRNAVIQRAGRQMAEARSQLPFDLAGRRLSPTQQQSFVDNPNNWTPKNPIAHTHATLALIGMGLPLADAVDALLYGGEGLVKLVLGDIEGAKVDGTMAMLAAGSILPGNETGLPLRLNKALQVGGYIPRRGTELAFAAVGKGVDAGKWVMDGAKKLKDKKFAPRTNFLGGESAKRLARAAHSVAQKSDTPAFTVWAKQVEAGKPTGASTGGAPSRAELLTGGGATVPVSSVPVTPAREIPTGGPAKADAQAIFSTPDPRFSPGESALRNSDPRFSPGESAVRNRDPNLSPAESEIKRGSDQARIYTESAGLPPEANQLARLSDEADNITKQLSTTGNRLRQLRAQKAALKYPSQSTPKGRKLDADIAMLETSIATNQARAKEIMVERLGGTDPITPANIPSRFEGTAVSPTTGRTMNVGEEMANRSQLAFQSADRATDAAHVAGMAANKNKPWASPDYNPSRTFPQTGRVGKIPTALSAYRLSQVDPDDFGEGSFKPLGPPDIKSTTGPQSGGTKLPGTADTPADTPADTRTGSANWLLDPVKRAAKNAMARAFSEAEPDNTNNETKQPTKPDVVKEVYNPFARRGDPTGEFRKAYSGLDWLRRGPEIGARIKEQRATPRSTTTPGYVPPSARGRLQYNVQTDEGRRMQNEQRLRQREAEFGATEAPYGRQTAEQHAAAEKRTGRRLPRGRPVDEETGKLLEYGEYLKGLDTRNEPGLDDRPEPEPTATDDKEKREREKRERERLINRRRLQQAGGGRPRYFN